MELHAVLGQQSGRGKQGPRPALAFNHENSLQRQGCREGFQERQVWRSSRRASKVGRQRAEGSEGGPPMTSGSQGLQKSQSQGHLREVWGPG